MNEEEKKRAQKHVSRSNFMFAALENIRKRALAHSIARLCLSQPFLLLLLTADHLKHWFYFFSSSSHYISPYSILVFKCRQLLYIFCGRNSQITFCLYVHMFRCYVSHMQICIEVRNAKTRWANEVQSRKKSRTKYLTLIEIVAILRK